MPFTPTLPTQTENKTTQTPNIDHQGADTDTVTYEKHEGNGNKKLLQHWWDKIMEITKQK